MDVDGIRARDERGDAAGDAARAIGEALAPMATAGRGEGGAGAAARRRRRLRPGYSGVFVRGENGEGFGVRAECVGAR